MWHGARLMVAFGLECARRGMPKGYLEHDRSVDVEPVRWDFDARVLEAAVGERFAAFEAGQVVVDVPSMSNYLPIRSTRHGGDIPPRPDLDRTKFVSVLVDDRLPFEVDLLSDDESADPSADAETVARPSVDDFVGV